MNICYRLIWVISLALGSGQLAEEIIFLVWNGERLLHACISSLKRKQVREIVYASYSTTNSSINFMIKFRLENRMYTRVLLQNIAESKVI